MEEAAEFRKKVVVDLISRCTGLCRAIVLGMDGDMSLAGGPELTKENALRAVTAEMEWLFDNAVIVQQKINEADSIEDVRDTLRGALVGCVNILDGKEKPFANVF